MKIFAGLLIALVLGQAVIDFLEHNLWRSGIELLLAAIFIFLLCLGIQ